MNNTNFKPSPYGGVGGGSLLLPRGLRNNNPLNIIRSATKWQGMSETQTDKHFVQFKTLAYGYRAAFLLIRTYMRKYGLLSIEQIIRRWAPPSENNTAAYIRTVSEMSGIKRDAMLHWQNEAEMIALVQAMAYVENGRIVMGDSIREGYRMAVKGVEG